MEGRFRLRRSSDFKLAREKGRSWAHPLLVLYRRRSAESSSRIGISVSRRIGKAVTRNRTKRVIREAVRSRLNELLPGWDIVFIARVPIVAATFVEVQAAVDELLRRAGVLNRAAADETSHVGNGIDASLSGESI